MSKKNEKQNETKMTEQKKDREARKRRPLTLEELKDVTGGLMTTCDSNGPSR